MNYPMTDDDLRVMLLALERFKIKDGDAISTRQLAELARRLRSWRKQLGA